MFEYEFYFLKAPTVTLFPNLPTIALKFHFWRPRAAGLLARARRDAARGGGAATC